MHQKCWKGWVGLRKKAYNKLRRAHQSVRMKNPPRARHAILLALVSNPHAISAAPIKEEPRYPAGSVTDDMCRSPSEYSASKV